MYHLTCLHAGTCSPVIGSLHASAPQDGQAGTALSATHVLFGSLTPWHRCQCILYSVASGHWTFCGLPMDGSLPGLYRQSCTAVAQAYGASVSQCRYHVGDFTSMHMYALSGFQGRVEAACLCCFPSSRSAGLFASNKDASALYQCRGCLTACQHPGFERPSVLLYGVRFGVSSAGQGLAGMCGGIVGMCVSPPSCFAAGGTQHAAPVQHLILCRASARCACTHTLVLSRYLHTTL